MSFVVSSRGPFESDLRFVYCPSRNRIIWSHKSVLCRSCVIVHELASELCICLALLLCVLDAYFLGFGNFTQVIACSNSNLPRLLGILMFLHDLMKCFVRDGWRKMSGSHGTGFVFRLGLEGQVAIFYGTGWVACWEMIGFLVLSNGSNRTYFQT